MSGGEGLLTALYLGLFLVGLRSTFRLWSRALARNGDRFVLLRAFAIIATFATAAAGVIGFLAIRSLAGSPRFEWSPVLIVVILYGIEFIPPFCDWVQIRIEEGRL